MVTYDYLCTTSSGWVGQPINSLIKTFIILNKKNFGHFLKQRICMNCRNTHIGKFLRFEEGQSYPSFQSTRSTIWRSETVYGQLDSLGQGACRHNCRHNLSNIHSPVSIYTPSTHNIKLLSIHLQKIQVFATQ